MLQQIPMRSAQLEKLYATLERQELKSVSITAANRGEGSSTIALALAMRAAAGGKKVLLVDTDLKDMELTKHFGERFDHSKQNLATTLQANIRVQTDANLSFLSAPNAQEILMSLRTPGTLAPIVANWSKQYELIIFDTSPVNELVDGLLPAEIVCSQTDCYALVVLSDITTELNVEDALTKLNEANANLLGSILNDYQHMDLKSDMSSSLDSLEKRAPKLANFLRGKLMKSSLFNFDS